MEGMNMERLNQEEIPSPKMKEFDSGDYGTKSIGLGKLTEQGIDVIMDSYEEKTGEYGQLLIITAKDVKTGEPLNLLTSSSLFKRMLDKNWDTIKGKPVNVSGHGQDFERKYKIRFLVG